MSGTDDAQPAGARLLAEIPVRRPFPWATLTGYLARRLTPGSEQVDAAGFIRREGAAEYRLRWDARRARLQLFGRGRIGVGAAERARLRAGALFATDFVAQPMQAVLAASPALAPRIARVPGLRPLAAWSPFELCLRTIIGQQVSVAAAATLMQRLAQRCGTRITPATLLEADLAAIGMPARRVATLQHLARAVHDGHIDLHNGDWAEVDAALRELPGFGPWTRAYLAIRLGRDADAFPEADLGLQRAAGAASARELLRMAEHWRPWRAHAATYLWAVPGSLTPRP